MVNNNSFYSKKSYSYHEYANLLPLMSQDQIREHGLSIKENGQEVPIVLLNEKILDGRNTYLACKMFNITPRFQNYNSSLDPLIFVKVRNIERRNLSSAQKAEIALEFLAIERRKARKRQIRTQFKRKEDDRKSNLQNTVGDPGLPTIAHEEKGKSIEKTASEFGMSPKTLRKAEKIKQSCEKDPEIKELWEKAQKNETSLEEVYRTMKNNNKRKMKESIANNFHEAGTIYMKKINQNKPQSTEVESTVKPQPDTTANLEQKPNNITCLIHKVAYNYNHCCYYCSNVKILRCVKCDKKCTTLTCSKGHDIKFNNDCVDFQD